MTTIAVKDGIMAVDGRATVGNLIVSEEFEKVEKFTSPKYGSVYVAFAGSMPHIVEAINFITSVFEETAPAPIKFDGTQMAMVMMTEEGDLMEANITEASTDISWIPCSTPYAVGSGDHIAIGAMEAGASAEEAVAISGVRDVFTNSNVATYSYKDLDYSKVINEQIETLQGQLDQLLKDGAVLPEELAEEVSEDEPVDLEEGTEMVSVVTAGEIPESSGWTYHEISGWPDGIHGDTYIEARLTGGPVTEGYVKDYDWVIHGQNFDIAEYRVIPS